MRETFESNVFTDLISKIKVFEKAREEKLTLSSAELLDGEHFEMVNFRKEVGNFVELNALDFMRVFQTVQIPTKEKYDNTKYIEKQEWMIRDTGFFVRATYHTCYNPVRRALSGISKYVYFNCSKEVREMIGHIQHQNMSNVVRKRKREVIKSEYEKREKEREEQKQSSEGSAFSFETSKGGKKKRENADASEPSDKRTRSVPANRKFGPENDNMDV